MFVNIVALILLGRDIALLGQDILLVWFVAMFVFDLVVVLPLSPLDNLFVVAFIKKYYTISLYEV